ncbi:Pogo transposable element with KRAB domain [Gracilariopsis chorda]|uniref:Pogo transposable element with KRAB domain n=1 Tax=Gracilariopsis chorda TaxID=448386 RepID=A0A2V3IXH1_9FLOR|nr:Pogo transposable element with KRAB domain [Gracilariopsis chorda]|eukprot:PXF46856.1 Pogo transposable element with KRAB domain [Gracilariopsis chorda]
MVSKRVLAQNSNRGYTPKLQNAIDFHRQGHTSLRKSADRFQVAKSHLHRSLCHKVIKQTRGRPPSLTPSEEQTICEAVLHFSNRGTPLSRECFKDMVQCYVRVLPQSRRLQILFKNYRPGEYFVRRFLRRHQEISLKRRSNLEKLRAIAMSPENLASHFARIVQVYKEYKINSPEQVFNIDESGFSVRTATRAHSKALFNSKGRSNSVELKWSGNAQHVTIMPVVSGDGRAWSPLVVLQGARAKYRLRADGTRETPSCYLPANAITCYRDPAGVDTAVFFEWVEHFVQETTEIRRKHRHIVLTFDGYGAHCSYKALKLLDDYGIIALCLPAHTSHRTQVLDYSVFSPFNNYFRNYLNERTLCAQDDSRNDVYTICDLLTKAYIRAVTYNNIVKGFEACGLWDPNKQTANPDVIKKTDIANIGTASFQEVAHENYLALVKDYVENRNMLRSDGEVVENGTLVTTAGALLTTRVVLDRLKAKELEKRAKIVERAARAAEAEARREQREQESVRRAEQRAQAQREKELFALWLSNRGLRWEQLSRSRADRRQWARLRAAHRQGATEV